MRLLRRSLKNFDAIVTIVLEYVHIMKNDLYYQTTYNFYTTLLIRINTVNEKLEGTV